MSIDNSSGGIVAGWYADPADATQMRYWDGSGWTERTAPLPAASPAAPAPTPAVAEPAPAAAAPAAAFATASLAPQPPAPAQYDDLTSVMAPATPAAASVPAAASSEFGGGFASSAPLPPMPAAVPAAAAGGYLGMPTDGLDSGRPVDEGLARTARMVSRVFGIIALLVLVLGVLAGIVVAISGLIGLTTVSDSDYMGLGILGAILAGVGVIIYAVVVWAFWMLLSIVARYIALRAG